MSARRSESRTDVISWPVGKENGVVFEEGKVDAPKGGGGSVLVENEGSSNSAFSTSGIAERTTPTLSMHTHTPCRGSPIRGPDARERWVWETSWNLFAIRFS